jgi:hypothetical protein
VGITAFTHGIPCSVQSVLLKNEGRCFSGGGESTYILNGIEATMKFLARNLITLMKNLTYLLYLNAKFYYITL